MLSPFRLKCPQQVRAIKGNLAKITNVATTDWICLEADDAGVEVSLDDTSSAIDAAQLAISAKDPSDATNDRDVANRALLIASARVTSLSIAQLMPRPWCDKVALAPTDQDLVKAFSAEAGRLLADLGGS